MVELVPGIRNAARALIIQQERILLLRKEGGGRGERFALPGGAQDPGETLKEALNRECMEEIGTFVDVGDLKHVADFFKLRDTQPPTRRHVVEFLFECTIAHDYLPRNGNRPDKHQVEVVWAELSEVPQLPLFPQFLSNCIPDINTADADLYLGRFQDQVSK
jgi:ADP-ribose pyrophosphatase YjhB (NUDIX family)